MTLRHPESPEPDNRPERHGHSGLTSRLSDDLRALLAFTAENEVRIRDIEDALRGRGFAVLIFVLTIPFCTPVPLPVISTPVGAALCLMGLRLAAGQKPWLPSFVLDHRVSRERLEKIVGFALAITARMERFVRPRWAWMHFRGADCFSGAMIALSSFVLAMPLGLPFTNSIPAWSILLLTLGRMERDGLLLALGHITGICAWVYLGLIFFAGKEGLALLWKNLFA